MNLNTRNQYDRLVLDFESQYENTQLAQRLQEKYKQKPLHIRLRGAKTIAIATSYVSNVVSYLSGFFLISLGLYIGFGAHINNTLSILLASVIAMFVMAGIEFVKRLSNDQFYIAKYWDKRVNKLALMGVLCSTVISVGVSWFGGYLLPSTVSPTPKLQEPSLWSLESIGNDFDKDIQALHDEKNQYFEDNKKPNGRGGYRLSSTLMPAYNKFNDRIAKLEEEKTGTIEAMRVENAKIQEATHKLNNELKAQHNLQNSHNSHILGFIVLFFELLFLVSMWFLQWIDYKTHILFLAISEQQEKENELVDNDQQNPTGQRQSDQHQQNESTVITDSNAKNEPYLILDGYKDSIFNHQRIKNFLYSYKSKLAKWQESKAKGNQPSEKSYNTITSNIAKWEAIEQKLLSKIQNPSK